MQGCIYKFVFNALSPSNPGLFNERFANFLIFSRMLVALRLKMLTKRLSDCRFPGHKINHLSCRSEGSMNCKCFYESCAVHTYSIYMLLILNEFYQGPRSRSCTILTVFLNENAHEDHHVQSINS